jgi:hypothetical protein
MPTSSTPEPKEEPKKLVTNRPKAILFMNISNVIVIVYNIFNKKLAFTGMHPIDFCLARTMSGGIHNFLVLKYYKMPLWPEQLSGDKKI